MKKSGIFLNMFFPESIKCIICDGELSRDTRYGVCDACAIEKNDLYCKTCGRAMATSGFCDTCKGHHNFAFDEARAPLVYSDAIHGLVYKLKYGGAAWAAQYMAQFMADSYLESGWTVDAVTFVPLHRKRERQRGYNQARLLAESVAEIVSLSVLDTCTRIKRTKNLARLKRDERKKEIEGAFAVIDAAAVKGKSLLLIDDVLTSGATSGECVKMLKKAGAKAVYLLTFATARIKPALQ